VSLRWGECFIVGISFGLFVKRILSHNACNHNSENSQNSVNYQTNKNALTLASLPSVCYTYFWFRQWILFLHSSTVGLGAIIFTSNF
jgi:hypothetical protein